MDTEHDSLTLRQMQDQVDNWIRTIGVRYFDPMTNTALLAEETGEVARVMARTYGQQVAKPGDKSDLADELADLLWVTVAIANQTGVDLTDAFRRNMAKKTSRDAGRFNR